MPHFRSKRGLDWHYEVRGTGDTIIMIHGLGASGEIWTFQQEFLKTDFQVLTLDLPGHGHSSWMPLTVAEMALDIRQLLRAAEISHFSMLASSMGGLIALELYRMVPDLVMRISMAGSIPRFARGPGYPAGLDIDKIRTLNRQFDGDYAAILEIFFRSLFTRHERESPRFKLVRELGRSRPLPRREALKHFLDVLEAADLRDRIASVICPMQFITGSEDYICPRAIMDWMAAHTHNARYDELEHCGHLPFLVEADEFNRLLEDFLFN